MSKTNHKLISGHFSKEMLDGESGVTMNEITATVSRAGNGTVPGYYTISFNPPFPR